MSSDHLRCQIITSDSPPPSFSEKNAPTRTCWEERKNTPSGSMELKDTGPGLKKKAGFGFLGALRPAE